MKDIEIQRAQEVLDDLEEYLSQARCELFSSNRIVVERTKIQEYLQLLRQYIK